MPVPKRKTSRTRRNQRRAHHALSATPLCACPRCREPKMPHRVCLHCGFYGDAEVVPMKEKKVQ